MLTSDIEPETVTGANFANGGYWNGPGIISSTAANDPTALTAVGVASAQDVGLVGDYWYAVQLQPGDVLLRYTYYGDWNLQGIVNSSDDSTSLSPMFGSGPQWYQTGGGFTNPLWETGDFQYLGDIQDNWMSDYDLAVVSDPHTQYFPTALSEPTVGPTIYVPEPGTLPLVAAGAAAWIGCCRWRRRRVAEG